jgi:hypothetical protein
LLRLSSERSAAEQPSLKQAHDGAGADRQNAYENDGYGPNLPIVPRTVRGQLAPGLAASTRLHVHANPVSFHLILVTPARWKVAAPGLERRSIGLCPGKSDTSAESDRVEGR